MAEKVVITGGDLDGSILDNAASEATLLRLVAVMEKKFGKGSSQLDKTQELYNKRLTEADKVVEQQTKKTKDLNKELDGNKEKYKQAAADFGSVLKTLSSGITKTIEFAFSGTETNIGQFSSALGAQIPIIGGIIGALGNALQGQIEAFRQLSRSGIDLGSSMYEAQRAAARTGLPLNVLTKTLSENSKSLALLGGNASTGAQRFLNISENLKRSGFTDRMARLGLTMEEGADLTAGYLEVQTRLGRSQKMTDAELTRGTEDYILQLDQLSRVTGMTRKEAQDALKQQMLDKRVRTVTQGMNEKQLKEYQNSLAALEKANPELAEGFKELVATGGIPVTELGKKLAIANPEFVKAAGNFKRGNGTFEELAGTVRNGAERLDSMGKGFQDTASTLSATGKDMGTGGYMMYQGLHRFGEGMTEAQKAQADAMENQKKNSAAFDRALTDLKNKLSVALLPYMDAFAKGMEVLIEVIGKLAIRAIPYIGVFAANLEKAAIKLGQFFDYIANTPTDKIIKDATDKIISSLSDAASSGLKALWENPKVLGALAVGIAGFFAIAVAKTAASRVVSNVGTGIADKLTGKFAGKGGAGAAIPTSVSDVANKGADIAGGAAGRAGETALSGIGKGLGAVGEGTLKGLASGLSAFANPQILIGAGILGASITAIGAGIAGAAWLTGKAMPTFAEGLKAFDGVNGDNLLSVAKGAAAMGAAMALFGAGSAVGTAGSVLSSLGNGIAGLFGAKTPIEKMREFAALGPGMEQTAKGFNEFSKAMVTINASPISTDTITKIEIGTNRLRALAAASREAAEAFKRLEPSMLDRLGDKITSVTSSLKEVGANISASVSSALSGGKKKTHEELLTDLNTKLDQLNTSMAQLVSIQQNSARDVNKTAKNTRTTAGSMY